MNGQNEKIQQAKASISPHEPEMNWSQSPFYSKHLAELGIVHPIEQGITILGLTGGLGYSGSNFYKAHHLSKLTHCAKGTEEWNYHKVRARVTPQHIELAKCYWIGRFQLRGCIGLSPLLFIFYMWSFK